MSLNFGAVKIEGVLKIKAGDSVGFIGEYEFSACKGDPQKQMPTQCFSHIEIFTADPQLNEFLSNQAQFNDGKQYYHIKNGTKLYSATLDKESKYTIATTESSLSKEKFFIRAFKQKSNYSAATIFCSRKKYFIKLTAI